MIMKYFKIYEFIGTIFVVVVVVVVVLLLLLIFFCKKKSCAYWTLEPSKRMGILNFGQYKALIFSKTNSFDCIT